MFRHPICDFVLLITTSNVVWWAKNVKTIFQEVTHAIGLRSSPPPIQIACHKRYPTYRGECCRYGLKIASFLCLKNFRSIADTQAFAISGPDRRMGRN
jgi:hypothetical protein